MATTPREEPTEPRPKEREVPVEELDEASGGAATPPTNENCPVFCDMACLPSETVPESA